MKIAILGCGHGGMALAAALKLKGAEVALWSDPEHASRFNKIEENGGILFQDESQQDDEKFVRLDLLSKDLSEVVHFAEIIYNCTPMNAHASLFTKIVAKLKKNKTEKYLINLSGVFSGVEQYLQIKNKKIFDTLKVFDTYTFPYACHAGKANDVKILGTKTELSIAPLFPKEINLIEKIPDCAKPTHFKAVENTFKLGLMGTNAVFHPATVIFNARLIDNGESFLFYKEGVSEKTAILHEALDQERRFLGKVMNYDLAPCVEDDNKLYNTHFKNNYDFCVNSQIHKNIEAPKTLKHRFITEDVAYGLVPLSALSKLYKVRLPNIDSVINIFSTIMGVDYSHTGRNLSGLTPYDIAQLTQESPQHEHDIAI